MPLIFIYFGLVVLFYSLANGYGAIPMSTEEIWGWPAAITLGILLLVIIGVICYKIWCKIKHGYWG